MAKLKRVLEAAEYQAATTATRDLYVERGGKYVLDADDAEGLQSTVDSVRAENKQMAARLAAFGELTPDQVKALQSTAEKAQRDKDFAAGNFDKILAESAEKHRKDMDLRDAGEARLRASLESALIDATAVRALAELKGNPELLLPIIKMRAKLQTVGDREVAVIIGEKGGPRLKAGAKNAEEFMDMSEYVAELKADKRYAGAFDSGVGSGSGSQRNGMPRPQQKAGEAERRANIEQQIRDGASVVR